MAMSEDRKVVDYFVVAGLQPDCPLPLEEYSNESIIKPTHKQDPITDITVINRSLNEKIPKGFICLERTTTAFPADLNHGSIRCAEMYLCYRRGRDKPPLMDIGILYEGKERLMNGCAVVHTTPFGHPANVNNSNSTRTYLTYRRASEAAASDTLAVVDICIILSNKGESPPHAYCQIAKNLNKGMVGSDVYVCYKKAMIKADVLAYKPGMIMMNDCVLQLKKRKLFSAATSFASTIRLSLVHFMLARYPLEDFDYFPLPESVPLFCLPMGATIECWSAKAQHPLPVFSTFVLTGAAGEKLYGAAVTFYEEFPEDKLTDLQMRHLGLKDKRIRQQYSVTKMAHSNKCICLLSHWPFFDAFKKFLSYLYKISITGPHAVPLERHISHFMFEVPYPSPQRPRILVQLNHEALSLCMPEDSPLPYSGASFITLLKNLGPDNCMNVMLYVLTEQKILIHSLRPAVLTGVAEAVSSMIFPFHWQCPYIPLCPLGLSTVLNAPIPFIVGIDSRYFDLYDPPTDVICVDLDTNTIWLPEDRRHLSLKQLPKKPAKVLQESLLKLYDRFTERSANTYHTHDEVSLEMPAFDHDFKRKRTESLMDLQIQEVLLRFMACLMKGYKNYLKPITKAPTLTTTNPTSLFDMAGFLKSRDKAYTKFFTQMMRTQTFIRFIEERSFVSDKDASLAFFDECTEKVEDTKDEPRLIELDDSYKSERTVLIMPPEPVGLPEGVKYSYNGFPDLNPELFHVVEPSRMSLSAKQTTCPNSPIARRTKHEIRVAQKTAHQNVATPILWAKCLLGHCYSLWFIHLPAYVKASQSKVRALRVAYEVLKKMQTEELQPPDEICYRVLLQLCGHYHVPVLAVKVLFEMKSIGVQPNAITYGYYNKAVLESKWPAPDSRALLLWTKLRIVVLGVARFKRFARRRSFSLCSNSGSDCDRISHASIDSCLEDTDKHDGQESEIKNITGADLVPVSENLDDRTNVAVSGSLADRTSTDHSYLRDEARRTMSVLAVQESPELDKQIQSMQSTKQQHTPIDKHNSLHLTFHRHRTRRKKPPDVTFDERVVESEAACVSRPRVGSIVRGSLASASHHTASYDTLKGDIVGHVAGLLMVSQSTLHDSLFAPHQSLSLLSFDEEPMRRRHKSTGSTGAHLINLKRRSNSMFSRRPHQPLSDQSKKMRADRIHKRLFAAQSGGSTEYDDLEDCDTDSDGIFPAIASHPRDASCDQRLEHVDDIVATDMIQQYAGELTDDGMKSTDTNSGSYSNKADSGVSLTEVGQAYTDSRRSPDHSAIPVLTDSVTIVPDLTHVIPNGDKPDSTDHNISLVQSNSSSPSSQTGSPCHRLGTPVTENDPLGMLDINTDLSGLTISMKSDHMETVLFTSPQSSRELSVHDDMNSMFKDDKFSSKSLDELDNNKSIPMSSRKEKSATIGSYSAVQSPVSALSASLGRKLIDISRAYSTPEGLSSTEKSQSAAWTLPFRQLAQQASLDGLSPQAEKVKEFAFRRTQSLRRSKDSFGGFLKSATNVMATKLNELKQSMASPGNTGSSNSLQQTSSEDTESVHSMEDTAADVPRGLSSSKRHSMDVLHEVARSKAFESGTACDTSSIGSERNALTGSPHPTTTVDSGTQSLFDQSLVSIRNWTDGTPSLLDVKQEQEDIVLMVEITSCCRCPGCNLLLYDEEIMTGWSAEDSNLNTSCIFCSVKLVPHLYVFIKDLRGRSTSGLCNNQPASQTECSQLPASSAINGMDSDVFHSTLHSPGEVSDNNSVNVCTSAHPDSVCDAIQAHHSSVHECDSLHDVKCDNSVLLETLHSPGGSSHNVEKTINTDTGNNVNKVLASSHSSAINDPEVLRRRCISECLTTATTSQPSRSPSDSIDSHYLHAHSPLELSIDEELASQSSTPQSIPDIHREFMLRTESGLSPIEVPYLSPLVLRKEVENILDNEGDMCLVNHQFLDNHPIIFWNLIWYFQRIGIPSHLPGFILTAVSITSNSDEVDSIDAYDHRHVSIQPMWDNPRIHDEPGLPMYKAWDQDVHSSSTVNALLTESESYPNSMLDEIIGDIKRCVVYKPIQLVMNWRRKSRRRRKRFRSIYRDILFLAIVACGKEKIDLEAYDREFRNGYNQLTPSEIRLLQPNDKPCAEKVICCRSMFKTLEI